MEFVGITAPGASMVSDADYVKILSDKGFKSIHLRKPNLSKVELRKIIDTIDEQYLPKVILHDHYELVRDYNLGGIHINKRNIDNVPEGVAMNSKSCHAIQELEGIEEYNYVFLSPIFDSISKVGYASAYSENELITARDNKYINSKVYALGGIKPDNIHKVVEWGFGGVAILGYLSCSKSISELEHRVKTIIKM